MPGWLRRGTLSALATLALAVTAPAAQAAPVLDGLNVNAHFLPSWDPGVDQRRELDAAAASGARWVRMSVSWNALESTGPRAYERAGTVESQVLARYDWAVREARARGLTVLMFVDATPAWANGTGAYAPDLPPVATRYADMAAFAGRMATRYRGQVAAWQIWNEPNLPSFWRTPSARAYGRLVRAVAPAIRRADPAAVIVSGGLSPDGTDVYAFVRGMYAEGIAPYVDALGLHAYPEATPETCVLRFDGLPRQKDLCAVPRIVETARRSDPGVPAWITEIAWSTYDHPGWGNYATEDQQAAYVPRAERVLAAQGVTRHAFWFWLRPRGQDPLLHSDGTGLLRWDYTPRPAFGAFAAVNAAKAHRRHAQRARWGALIR